MEKFVWEVKMTVEVEAFGEADAWDLVQENFGVGEDLGITVIECEYKELKPRK